MKLDILPLSKDQIESENKRLLAIMNGATTAVPGTEVTPAEARHVAGQMAMQNPQAAHAMAIFMQLDPRGQAAMINCGVFHLRYPQEK